MKDGKQNISTTYGKLLKISDPRWLEFESEPNPGEYKDFRMGSEKKFKISGKIQLKFTNGEKEIIVSGEFRDEAYIKMFDRIDEYHSQK